MIPLLESIVSEIISLWEDMAEQRDKLESCSEEEKEKILEEIRKMSNRNIEVIDEIENLGCALESYSKGIVDIPTIIRDREVILCWKFGEEQIEYYHMSGENIENRLPLETAVE